MTKFFADQKYKHGLELRLFKTVLAVTLAYAVLAGAYVFKAEYRRASGAAFNVLDQLVKTIQTQAAIAVYTSNQHIADEVGAGLLLNKYAAAVTISAANGAFAENKAKANPLRADWGLRKYVLYSPLAESEAVGELVLYVDTSLIEADARDLALEQAFLVMLQALILAVLVVLILRQMFSRPVTQVADQLSELYIGDGQRIQVSAQHRNNEIGMLSTGINRLVETGEDALRQLTVQKNLAEESNASKARFLAAASHDLRQPMHALNMYLGVLEEKQLPGEAHELLSNAQKCGKIMDDMFATFLDISRLDADAVKPQISVFAINELFDALLIELNPLAMKKQLRLDFVRSSLQVQSDRELLKNILRNLVSNAIRYTDKGRVLVGCRRTQETVTLFIYDTGIGVSASDQQAIFEEFYRAGSVKHNRPHGLGLGLAIVKRLCKLLQLELGFASVLGEGSVFSVRVARAHLQLQAAPSDAPAPADWGKLLNARILVVDDDAEVLKSVCAILKQFGCEAIGASSRAEAMQKVIVLDRAPDVLLCDYRLSEESTGIEVIDEVREEFAQDIPALLITGDTHRQFFAQQELTDITVLYKPLQAQTLRTALARIIR